MWLFAAVAVAIATPCFRAWLEALFAELSIVFFTYLRFWAVFLSVILALAIASDCRRWLARRSPRSAAADHGGVPRVNWCRGRAPAVLLQVKATTSEIAGSGVYPHQAWSMALLALTMLPIINSVMVGGGLRKDSQERVLSNLAGSTATIEQQLTTCKYADSDQCLSNVTAITALGTYRQAPGYCVAFDAAYVNVSTAGAGLPSQYYPIAVDDASAEGYANNFSEWSDVNQDKFQADCPLLYQELAADDGQELLCCTEGQYEVLSTQIRQLPGLCPTCQQNLRHMWCQFTCSPNNSMFIEVNQVRLIEGDAEHAGEIFPAIEEATYYVGSDVVRDVFDYCEADTAFASLLCDSARNNCSSGSDLLREMGSYRFDSIGSPSQINFSTIEDVIAREQQDKLCSCNASSSSSSSSSTDDTDSSTASETGCFSPMNVKLPSCADTCGDLCAVSSDDNRSYLPACYDPAYFTAGSGSSLVSTQSVENENTDSTTQWESLMTYLSKNVQETNFTALNYLLVAIGFALACVLAAGVFYSTRYHKKKNPMNSMANDPRSIVGGGVPTGEDAQFFGPVDKMSTKLLKKWGECISIGYRPYCIIAGGLLVLAGMSCGLIHFKVQSDAVKMWTPESSTVLKHSSRFVELFGSIPRSEQILLVPKDGGVIARTEYLEEAIRLQELIANNLTAYPDNDDEDAVALDDICLNDTPDSSCRMTSITQFFQNRLDHFKVYADQSLELEHLKYCVHFPATFDVDVCTKLKNVLGTDGVPTTMANCPCAASFGEPIISIESYLGGYPAKASSNVSKLLEATAMMSEALVPSYDDDTASDEVEAVYRWERAFIDRMKAEAAQNTLFDIYFSAGTSFQDDVDSESSVVNVVKPVATAYALTALYVVFKLNSLQTNKRYFVTSRFGIGLIGVACSALAVTSTLGLFAWGGAEFDSFTLVGLPILALGITIGHVFSILDALELKQSQLYDEQRAIFVGLEDNATGLEEVASVLVAEALSLCGPGIAAVAMTQCLITLLVCVFAVPSIRLLSSGVGISAAITLVVHLTIFACIVVVDKRRELSGRYDFFCCVRSSTDKDFRVSEDEIASTTDGTASSGGCTGSHNQPPLGERLIERYVNIVTRKASKVVVLAGFTCSALLCIVSIEKLEWGMPPSDVLPSNSYTASFLVAKDKFQGWMVDPSVYFVVEGGYGNNAAILDLIDDENTQAKFCTSKEFCDELSVPNILEAVVSTGHGNNAAYFKQGVTMNSWLDEFWSFVSAENDCCRVNPDDDYAYVPALAGDNTSAVVARSQLPSCLSGNTSDSSTIPGESFMSLFAMFASTPTTATCSYAAAARHFGEFSIDNSPAQYKLNRSSTVYLNGTDYGNNVTAFAYKLEAAAPQNNTSSMLKKLISGYAQARALADWISDETGVDVWVYSQSYGFLDQFRTVGRDSYLLVGLALVVVFSIFYFALIDFWLTLAISAAGGTTAVSVMGLMEPLGISLNAFTAMNAIIAMAISLESSSRFARAFAAARRDPTVTSVQSGDACASAALRQELGNMLSGATFPKVIAFASLGLSSAGCFQVTGSGFRMLLGAVVFALLNSAVLLPVIMSVAVDAAQGRVRQVKRTNEYGNEYERESPTASYFHANARGNYPFGPGYDNDQYGYRY